MAKAAAERGVDIRVASPVREVLVEAGRAVGVVTEKGEALALKLAQLQTTRITRALNEVGPDASEAARKFLAAIIDTDGRAGVLDLIGRANVARRRD